MIRNRIGNKPTGWDAQTLATEIQNVNLMGTEYAGGAIHNLVGSSHAVSGLDAGPPAQYLKATAATSFGFGYIAAADLPNTAVMPASYGDATHVATFTVDAQGRLMAASNVEISGGPPAAHNILDSTYHSDVLTGSITRGDILYGNSTPKIARLAKGASGAFLTCDANDVKWSTLTLPNAATQGDLLYASSANAIGVLSDVAAGQVLTSGGVGAAPAYSDSPTLTGLTLSGLTASTVIYSNASKAITSLANATGYLTNNGAGSLSWSATATATVHNLLSATHGDTTPAACVRGDLITGQGASPVWARLAKGTQYQVLTGGADEPTWGQVALNQATAITGTLPVGNGGTGLASWTQYGIIYASATTTLAQLGFGTTTTILHGNASGAPMWAAVNLAVDVIGTLPGSSVELTATCVGYGGAWGTLTESANLTYANSILSVSGSSGARFLAENAATTQYSWAGVMLINDQIASSVNRLALMWMKASAGAATGAAAFIIRKTDSSSTNYVDYLRINSDTNNIIFNYYKAGEEAYGDIVFANGDVGVGTDSPSAKLHVLATTEQLRLGYDASNYLSVTIDSSGKATFNAVGSNSSFVFSDSVSFTSGAFAASGQWFGALTDGATGGFYAGAEGDVTLYRSAAGTWYTPDTFHMAGSLLQGSGAVAYHAGERVLSCGNFSGNGDCEFIELLARRSVAHSDNSTWYELFIDGSSARITIPADSVWYFYVIFLATTVDVGTVAQYYTDGIIKRVGNTTSAPVLDAIASVYEGDAAWNVRVSADDTNESLKLEVLGNTGQTIRWSAWVRLWHTTFT